jgi:hypothetical protein
MYEADYGISRIMNMMMTVITGLMMISMVAYIVPTFIEQLRESILPTRGYV